MNAHQYQEAKRLEEKMIQAKKDLKGSMRDLQCYLQNTPPDDRDGNKRIELVGAVEYYQRELLKISEDFWGVFADQ